MPLGTGPASIKTCFSAGAGSGTSARPRRLSTGSMSSSNRSSSSFIDSLPEPPRRPPNGYRHGLGGAAGTPGPDIGASGPTSAADLSSATSRFYSRLSAASDGNVPSFGGDVAPFGRLFLSLPPDVHSHTGGSSRDRSDGVFFGPPPFSVSLRPAPGTVPTGFSEAPPWGRISQRGRPGWGHVYRAVPSPMGFSPERDVLPLEDRDAVQLLPLGEQRAPFLRLYFSNSWLSRLCRSRTGFSWVLPTTSTPPRTSWRP